MKLFKLMSPNNKSRVTNNEYGFTFIELMLVIAILGVLLTLVSGNFLSSLKKGRDAKRKADLEQIQRAVEIYYDDNRAYPLTSSINFSGGQLCHPSGCATKVYMQKIPNDPKSTGGYTYRYCTNATNSQYQLYALFENSNDPKIITVNPLSTCTTNCYSSGNCNYGISSADTSP